MAQTAAVVMPCHWNIYCRYRRDGHGEIKLVIGFGTYCPLPVEIYTTLDIILPMEDSRPLSGHAPNMYIECPINVIKENCGF